MNYIEDMLQIGQMEPGEKLYHYTSADGLLGIIQNKEFWVTKWCFLNDHSEFSIGKIRCIDLLKKHGIDSQIIDDIANEINSFFPSFNKKLYRDYFVLSFSIERDSLMMWSGYAGQMGICLGIDHEQLKKSFKFKFDWEGCVIYNSIEQEKCIEKAIENKVFGVEDFGNISTWKEINTLSGSKLDLFITYISITSSLYNMFFKEQCFSEEKEYRYVFTTGRTRDTEHEELFFRTKKGTIIPYIKRKFDTLSFMDEIIIGPVSNMDISLNGIENLLIYNQCNIEVHKSKVPLRY